MYTKKKIDNFGPFYLITKFKKERIKNVFIKNWKEDIILLPS